MIAVRKRLRPLRAAWRTVGQRARLAAPFAAGQWRAGWCPVCRRGTAFVQRETWLRDHYLCANCLSIPRQRGLMYVLEQLYPR